MDAIYFSPSFIASAIAVGSIDPTDSKAGSSNYGSLINIWAPGVSILSAGQSSDTDARTISGTESACPHVAGGAALVLQRNPTYNYAKVLETLQSEAIADVITGFRAGAGDVNRLLYVGGGGGGPAPPSPGPAPTPGPSPAPSPGPTPSPAPTPTSAPTTAPTTAPAPGPA